MICNDESHHQNDALPLIRCDSESGQSSWFNDMKTMSRHDNVQV